MFLRIIGQVTECLATGLDVLLSSLFSTSGVAEMISFEFSLKQWHRSLQYISLSCNNRSCVFLGERYTSVELLDVTGLCGFRCHPSVICRVDTSVFLTCNFWAHLYCKICFKLSEDKLWRDKVWNIPWRSWSLTFCIIWYTIASAVASYIKGVVFIFV